MKMHAFLYKYRQQIILITKNYADNFVHTNTPYADGYNLKLECKEFD